MVIILLRVKIWCHYKVEWVGMIRLVGKILNFVHGMKLEKNVVRV
jgi:hypothetical protein